MSNLYPEFFYGARTDNPAITINFDAPVKSPIKSDMFDGVHPYKDTDDASLSTPVTDVKADFDHPNVKEQIPAKASISGMV